MFWLTFIWKSAGRYQALFSDRHTNQSAPSEWASVPTQLRDRHPWEASPLEGTVSFTERIGGSRHWKWKRKKGMRGKNENGGGNKKNQCFPMSFDKNAVFKMVTFTKRSFDKKVTSFNRRCVWQMWLEEEPGRVALAVGQVQRGFLCVLSLPPPALGEVFFRLPRYIPLLQGYKLWFV